MADRRTDQAPAMSAPRAPRYDDRGDGWTLAAELVTATFVWGGIGWLADRWLTTAPVLMVLGFVLGNALGVYLIWVRSQDRFTREHGDLMARRARTRTVAPGIVPDGGDLGSTPAPATATGAAHEVEPDDPALRAEFDDDKIVAPLYEGDRRE